MSEIIEILEEYKKINSYVSLKRLSKRLNLPIKKTRRLIYSNPKILKIFLLTSQSLRRLHVANANLHGATADFEPPNY